MKFHYVYVLMSKARHFMYVGYSTDLIKRFHEHNNNKVLSTKYYAPLELIHYEAYRSMKDAKRREKYFKTTKGKVVLRMMLKEYLSRSEAMKREIHLKKLTKAKKEALIKG